MKKTRFYCYGKKDFCDKNERCNSEKNPDSKCEFLNGAGGVYKVIDEKTEDGSDE
jgi:hypothetical protein